MLDRLKRYLAGPALPALPSAPRRPVMPVPAAMTLDERIDMAARCRDCDILPKAPDAGEVVTEADGIRVQITHNGLRMTADGHSGAWMTELIARCHGHHEPQEERAFHEIVRRMPPAATMIELGAWWSFYTLWFLKDAPDRVAVALEPDPEHMAVGQVNAARNGLAPRFVTGFAGGTEAPSAPFMTEAGHRIEIPRLTVPGLMAANGIEVLDLLHCDAQGVELDVLRSSAALLQEGRIRTLVISTHHQTISGDPLTHQRCLALVEECGGAVIAEHDVHESFSGDGLIAARFGPDQAGWPVIPLSLNRYSTSLFRNPLFDLADALES
jgi:FkbM family methyltransferase